jgi:hypothetical protein
MKRVSKITFIININKNLLSYNIVAPQQIRSHFIDESDVKFFFFFCYIA